MSQIVNKTLASTQHSRLSFSFSLSWFAWLLAKRKQHNYWRHFSASRAHTQLDLSTNCTITCWHYHFKWHYNFLLILYLFLVIRLSIGFCCILFTVSRAWTLHILVVLRLHGTDTMSTYHEFSSGILKPNGFLDAQNISTIPNWLKVNRSMLLIADYC